MKYIFLFSIVALFAACNPDRQPRTTFVSIETPVNVEPQRAYNVAISKHGVTATYTNPDASFHLRFDQCIVVEMDGKTELLSADVYQIAPSVYVAELPDGYIRLNARTGVTVANFGSVNRQYFKGERP